MGTFGERLQREREMRGITLEEIAEATKIGTRSLRALEQQDFDKLPGGIFNKGFVRAYSKYLGIDEDQAVADYMNALSEAQATTKPKGPEVALPTIDEAVPEREPVRVPWGLLIIIALIVAVAFAAKSYYSKYGWAKLKREATPVQAAGKPAQVPSMPGPQAAAPTSGANPAAGPAETATGAIVPAAAAGTNADQAGSAPSRTDLSLGAQAPASDATGFSVKVRAKEKSYVVLQADGVDVYRGNLEADAEKELRGTKTVLVYTSNAGGIEVSHNGQLLSPIGAGKEKKTVVLTPRGLQ